MADLAPMKLLDRYLIKETIVPFLIGAVAAILLLVGGFLQEWGRMLFDRQVSYSAVLQLLFYRLPFLVVIAAPVATAVGTSMAVSRLARDQEITVIRMTGVSVARIFLPYVLMGVFMFALTFWFQEAVVPESGKSFKKVLYQISMMQSQPSIAPNTVVKVQDYTFVLGYVTKRQDNAFVITDLTAIRAKALHEMEIWRAPEGIYNNGVFLIRTPQVWMFDRNGGLKSFVVRKEGRIDKRVPLQDIYAAPQPDEMTMRELGEQIALQRKVARDSHDLLMKEVQYQAKLSVPFACVIFALFGPIFALMFARSGGFAGILLSVVLVFLHINLLLLFTRFIGEYGILPPVIAAWAPNAIFLAAALIALRKIE